MKRILLSVVVFAALFGAVLFFNQLSQHDMVGKVVVVDGDSLKMNAERLRLIGVDAPELAQKCFKNQQQWACGRKAKRQLQVLIGRGVVKCTTHGVDYYDRWLVKCFAHGKEINAELVKSGWAVDYGGYASEEQQAKSAQKGIWQGRFERPQQWRRSRRDKP